MRFREFWWLVPVLLALPGGMVGANQDSGIPPMLETQRPLSHPSVATSQQPAPSPQATLSPTDLNKPRIAAIQKVKKQNRSAIKSAQKKGGKLEKRRGITAKPRSRSGSQRT